MLPLFVQTVCKFWLLSGGKCMRGDACGYLHTYDEARIPVCPDFARTGTCRVREPGPAQPSRGVLLVHLSSNASWHMYWLRVTPQCRARGNLCLAAVAH